MSKIIFNQRQDKLLISDEWIGISLESKYPFVNVTKVKDADKLIGEIGFWTVENHNLDNFTFHGKLLSVDGKRLIRMQWILTQPKWRVIDDYSFCKLSTLD